LGFGRKIAKIFLQKPSEAVRGVAATKSEPRLLRFKRVVALHFADTSASIGIATGTYLPNTPANLFDGRPDECNRTFQMRVTDDFLKLVDSWRKRHPYRPLTPIRLLVEYEHQSKTKR
jgi:hypothetical protein